MQARGSAGWTPDKTSVGQAVRKLESLIKQLDSLLPYLGVAINAVNLLNTGTELLWVTLACIAIEQNSDYIHTTLCIHTQAWASSLHPLSLPSFSRPPPPFPIPFQVVADCPLASAPCLCSQVWALAIRPGQHLPSPSEFPAKSAFQSLRICLSGFESLPFRG